MSKEDYRDDHSVMSDLLEVVVGSLDHASRNGVPLASGGKLHPVCLGNKGDWPYLVSCCRFNCFWFLHFGDHAETVYYRVSNKDQSRLLPPI